MAFNGRTQLQMETEEASAERKARANERQSSQLERRGDFLTPCLFGINFNGHLHCS